MTNGGVDCGDVISPHRVNSQIWCVRLYKKRCDGHVGKRTIPGLGSDVILGRLFWFRSVWLGRTADTGSERDHCEPFCTSSSALRGVSYFPQVCDALFVCLS